MERDPGPASVFRVASRTDVISYEPSVKTYLRMLGRNRGIHNIVPPPSASKIADAEMAGGWCVLRRARYPRAGERGAGVFFDAAKITPEAIRQCPTMPYLYNITTDDIQDQLDQGLTLSHTERPYVCTTESDPHFRLTRNLVLSNAIVPLPSPSPVDPQHPDWEDMIAACYRLAHPVVTLANFPHINHDNNEKLILAASEQELSYMYFSYPDRNHGLDKEKDEAYKTYLRDYLDFDPENY